MAFGKETSAELAGVQQNYERRLKPLAEIKWHVLPASRHTAPDTVRNEESQRLLEVLKPSDTIILLDERGQQQTNEQFAKTFQQLSGGQGRLVLVIGGAFGVNDALRERAQFVWSFSKLVFPHQLVRVLLLEQLYRTFMVLQNHPYHHT